MHFKNSTQFPPQIDFILYDILHDTESNKNRTKIRPMSLMNIVANIVKKTMIENSVVYWNNYIP